VSLGLFLIPLANTQPAATPLEVAQYERRFDLTDISPSTLEKRRDFLTLASCWVVGGTHTAGSLCPPWLSTSWLSSSLLYPSSPTNLDKMVSIQRDIDSGQRVLDGHGLEHGDGSGTSNDDGRQKR
jgi:hypothetical protein